MPIITLQQHIDELFQASHLHLADVMPEVADAAYSIISDIAKEEGLYFGVFMGYRTPAQQHALWVQGRYPLSVVNHLRVAAKLGEISQADNAHKVTDLDFGFHNLGLAVDFVEDGDTEKAGVQWSWAKSRDFLKLGKYIKRYGMDWGGSLWPTFIDNPHMQLSGGYISHELKVIHDLKGQEAVWEMVRKNWKCPTRL